MNPWLRRVRHDLVKRLAWPARDRRDAGGAPAPGELVPALVDDEGRATTASALWAALRRDAPRELELAHLAAFERAVAAAERAAAAGDVDGVLVVEAAFEALALALARIVEAEPDGT